MNTTCHTGYRYYIDGEEYCDVEAKKHLAILAEHSGLDLDDVYAIWDRAHNLANSIDSDHAKEQLCEISNFSLEIIDAR